MMQAIGGLLAVTVVMAVPGLALAHAQLRSALPPVGGTVSTAPAQVEITYSEAVEPRFSSIVVTDAAGNEVDRKDLHVAGNDAHHVAVGLGPIGPGDYHVVWHATSVDTHKTEGSYTFRVSP